MIAEIEGNIDDLINKLKMPEGEIPVLPTKNLVLFPGVMLPILVARNPSAEQMLSASIRSGEEKSLTVFWSS